MNLEVFLGSILSSAAIGVSVIALLAKYFSLSKARSRKITALELKVRGGDKPMTIDTTDLNPEKVELLLDFLRKPVRPDPSSPAPADADGAPK